ncbi:hypothetical protein GF324_12475, partial [bacterium]|nr:hypothetical protein [bacterium]
MVRRRRAAPTAGCPRNIRGTSMHKRLLQATIFLILLLLSVVPAFAAGPDLGSSDALSELFRSREEGMPRISAHRGGPLPGYPENCIETFEHAVTYGPVLIECDVRMTADSVLILMHDETLDRTTSGEGEVAQMTWSDLLELTLVDNLGFPTTYTIPTFREAMRWARGRYIMTVDVKRGVPFQKVVQEIQQEDAAGSAVVITYSPDAAAIVHALDSTLMLSVPGTSRDVHDRLIAEGIPYHRMVAFVGTRVPDTDVIEM